MATKTDDGLKKFGSSMVAKRYNAFHPKESSYDGGDQPSVESTPMEHGEDAVNTPVLTQKGTNLETHMPKLEHPVKLCNTME
jgi:hypothetical protein